VPAVPVIGLLWRGDTAALWLDAVVKLVAVLLALDGMDSIFRSTGSPVA